MSEDLPLKTLVLIATPIRGADKPDDYHPRFKLLLNGLAALSQDDTCPWEFIFATIDMGVVPARNRIVANARKHKCKWVVFVDYDIEVEPDQIVQLLSKKIPVIGGLYTTREVKAHWVCNFLYEAEKQKESALQVIEAGTGLLAIHIETFDILQKHFPQISYTDRDTGEKLWGFFQHAVVFHDLQQAGDLLPEDFFFCFLCRTAGIPIFVDSEVKVKHRGPDGQRYPLGDWPEIPAGQP